MTTPIWMLQAHPGQVRPKCHRSRVRINKIINLELTQDFRLLPSTGEFI
jgi:hypothetical protein